MAPKDRKALGTGLSALFGDLSPGSDEMTTLPLSRIEPREDDNPSSLQNRTERRSAEGCF